MWIFFKYQFTTNLLSFFVGLVSDFEIFKLWQEDFWALCLFLSLSFDFSAFWSKKRFSFSSLLSSFARSFNRSMDSSLACSWKKEKDRQTLGCLLWLLLGKVGTICLLVYKSARSRVLLCGVLGPSTSVRPSELSFVRPCVCLIISPTIKKNSNSQNYPRCELTRKVFFPFFFFSREFSLSNSSFLLLLYLCCCCWVVL